MSTQIIAILITGVLLLHGLGHGGAIGALIAIDHGVDSGKWLPARSWLFPKLAPRTAKEIAIIFWTLSLFGFVAAALSFWGILLPVYLWRTIALIFAFVSLIGITLFWGTWPMFNTLAAQVVNLTVIITQLWLHWPPVAVFGK
jgi:carbon starvation protein CstA